MWLIFLLAMLLAAAALTAVLARFAARRLGVGFRDTLIWLGVFAEPADHAAAQASRAERRARDARKARESRRRTAARGTSASSRTMARRVA
jgi:hypothetical protein